MKRARHAQAARPGIGEILPEGHAFLAISLDGYIARPDGGLDWLDHPGAAAEDHGYEAFVAGMDGIVMGRRTYETVLGFGAWPYRLPCIVLSASMEGRPGTPPGAPQAAKVSRANSPEKAWAQASALGWRRVYVDGGETIRAFLDRGMLTEMILTTVPVALGEGRPLFAPRRRDLRLSLRETRSFPSGLVQSRYALGD